MGEILVGFCDEIGGIWFEFRLKLMKYWRNIGGISFKFG